MSEAVAFIRLTLNSGGESIVINTAHITGMISRQGYSRVDIVGGEYYWVKESLDVILQRIELCT